MKADFEKGTKICSGCRKELPLNMFGKNKNRSDGLHYYCKVCASIKNKYYYHRNPEYSKEKAKKNSDKRTNTFKRKGIPRGSGVILKRDYELTDEQLKCRERNRKYSKHKQRRTNVQGLLIQYDGKLNNLDSKEYARIMYREYHRQRTCAINGYFGRTKPSEHFLFDFDLEQLLNDNAYISVRNGRKHITKWWKGEIRHWTVNDGIWREQ